MNNLLDMLAKAGYEVSSIGNDVLPCTLRLGEDPIGFLMGDLSLRLLPEQEKERGRLQPVLTFSAENQGIEQERGECVLSRYRDVLFTANFDYDSCRPVYNIYSRGRDNDWTLLNSSEDRAAAARDYAARSGLVSGEIPEPARDVGRIERFMDTVREKGYQFRESRDEAHRAFDITDRDGHEVGYIGKDNRVSITSENDRVRHTLTGAYLESSSENVLLPSFFERLKEQLKAIGMALKILFTPQGRHYAVHNGDHQEIASVGEQTHTVTYTDQATDAEKARIDALVDELRREEEQKGRETQHIEPEKEAVASPVAAVSTEEIERFTNAVLSDHASTEAFLNAVLSNPQFTAMLNQKLAEMRQTSAPDRVVPAPAAEKDRSAPAREAAAPTIRQNPSAEKLRQEFDRDYSYLQTLFGFNQEKYDALRADMATRFGTDDPKEFQTMLDAGKFDASGKLQGRLETSRKIADMKNAVRQTEKTQEKERL